MAAPMIFSVNMSFSTGFSVRSITFFPYHHTIGLASQLSSFVDFAHHLEGRMTLKAQYRIRNWKDYNTSLKQRGSITVWFSEDSIDKWHATSTGLKVYARLPTIRSILNLLDKPQKR
jgi:hypothetical protein